MRTLIATAQIMSAIVTGRVRIGAPKVVGFVAAIVAAIQALGYYKRSTETFKVNGRSL